MMEALALEIIGVLERFMAQITARSVLDLSIRWARVDIETMGASDKERLQNEIQKGVRLYVERTDEQDACLRALATYLENSNEDEKEHEDDKRDSVSISIHRESDIVLARNEGRDICQRLGFELAPQIKVSTVISELARNIVLYAGSGQIVITALSQPKIGIEIVSRDQGPGIADLTIVLSGKYTSKTGMGMGLFGTRNLMDDFEIDSQPGKGTEVTVRKYLQ